MTYGLESGRMEKDGRAAAAASEIYSRESHVADTQEYDIVILGAGSGGYAAAMRAGQLGLKVALVEGDKVGGTCLHRGCIPTKAILHAAEVADEARDGAHIGVKTSFEGMDMDALNAYKDGVVAKMFKGLTGLIKSRGVEIVEGFGRLTGENTVQVDDRVLKGKNIVLATGSYSKSLPGLDIEGRVITSDKALQMTEVPSSVIVLGGGVIGCEFASAWKSMGADVTIIEGLDHLVPNEDEAVSKTLERAFRKRKITFKTKTRFSGVEQSDSGVKVSTEDGKTYEADYLLVAIGRGPATANLGYEEVGVKLDRGFVITDEKLHTGVGNIYAVGDIVPGLQLAHRGFLQGIYVAELIAGENPAPIDETLIPRVTYSNPEVASVGLTTKQAVEAYGKDNVETVEFNLAGNGKSQMLETAGFVKLVREKDGPIVGFHAIGARMGEQVGEGQLMVAWEAEPIDFEGLIHAHPTQNEAVGEAILALAGKPLHTHN